MPIRDGRTSYSTPRNRGGVGRQPTTYPGGGNHPAQNPNGPNGGFGGDYGIKPTTIDTFFQQHPNSSQASTWAQNRQSAFDAYNASIANQQAAWQSKIADFKAQAVAQRASAMQKATLYNQRAKSLLMASKGNLTQFGKRTADFYGFDVGTKQGRLAAAQFAQHLSTLAASTNTDQGVLNIVNFDKVTNKSITDFRNQQLAQANKQHDNNGILGRLAGGAQELVSGGFVGLGLNAMDKVFGWGNAAYSAGKYAQLTGGSTFDQLAAIVASVPGQDINITGLGSPRELLAPKGSAARKAIEATNTTEERSKLTKQGKLLSLGQAVYGQYGGLGKRERQLAYQSQFVDNSFTRSSQKLVQRETTIHIGSHTINLASGGFDAVFNIAEDPTLALGKVFKPFQVIGYAATARAIAHHAPGIAEGALQEITRVARKNFITTSRTGTGVIEETVRGVRKYNTPEAIQKVLGAHTPRTVADELFKARAGGTDVVRETLQEAYAKGVWQPERSIIGRAAAAAKIPLTKGPGTLPAIGDALRNMAAGRGKVKTTAYNPVTGAVLEAAGSKAVRSPLHIGGKGSLDDVLFAAVDAAAGHNKEFVGDVVNRFQAEDRALLGLEDAQRADQGLVRMYRGEPTDEVNGALSMFNDLAGGTVHGDPAKKGRWFTTDLGYAKTHARIGGTIKYVDIPAEDVAKYLELKPGLPTQGVLPDDVVGRAVSTSVDNIGVTSGMDVETIYRDVATRGIALDEAARTLDVPALQSLVEDIQRPLRIKLFEDLTPLERDQLLERVKYAETIVHIARGDAGENARLEVLDLLQRGWNTPSAARRATKTVARLVSEAHSVNWNPTMFEETPRAVAEIAAGSLPPGPLHDMLAAELALAKDGSKKYGETVHAIWSVESSRKVAFEAERALELYGERSAVHDVLVANAMNDGATIFQHFLSGGSALLTSVVEKAAPNILRTAVSPFADYNQQNIATTLNRLSGSLRLTAAEQRALAGRVEAVAAHVAEGGTPKAAYELAGEIVSLGFEHAGLTADEGKHFMADLAHAAESGDHNAVKQAFGVVLDGEDWKLLERPMVGAQAQTNFLLPDLKRIEEGIRQALHTGGTSGPWTEIRVHWDEFKNISWEFMGKTRTIKGGVNAALRFWKVMVTTRLYLAGLTIGAQLAVGVDPLQALVVGAAVGGFGFIRYKSRMSIQNRLDAWLDHGPVPSEIVPGMGYVLKHHDRPIYGSGANALYPDPQVYSWVEGRVGAQSREGSKVWEVITPTGGKRALDDYVEGYHRIINLQLNPETDEITRILLLEKSGKVSKDESKQLIDDWLATDDGALWIEKMRGTGARNANKAVKKYQAFVDQYVPSADLAALRLERFGPGKEITHQELRDMLDSGADLPVAIHFQRSESVLRHPTASGAWKSFKRAYENAAYDSARSPGFKETFFAQERRLRESEFRSAGVPVDQARELAGSVATARTNAIMFRYDNVSRFAHAIDWFAPFTGHRMFNIETWSKLAVTHPGRTIRTAVHGATAFNAMKGAKVFYPDQYGTWSMTVPGSAWLSAQLGGGPDLFRVNLSGFLALSSELQREDISSNPAAALGLSYIPHPGGLWWGAAGKVLKEVHPDLVDPSKSPLPEGVLQFLYPYGPNAGILTPDAARMLRVMVGTSGPWNLLDDGQGIEDINKWEVKHFRDMVAEHRKADVAAGRPVDMEWTPSLAEVRDRTMGMFNVWSLLQTTLPAAPHPSLHNEEDFNKLWKQWLGPLANTKMDYASYQEARSSFTEAYPAYALYLDRTTKWTGGDSTADWLKQGGQSSQSQRAFDQFTGSRSHQDLGEYQKQFRQLRKNQEYNTAWSHAIENPNPMNRERDLQAVREKFPNEAAAYRVKTHAEADLARILYEYPKQLQAQAIERWRHDWAPKGQVSLSHGQFLGMKASIERSRAQHRDGQYHLSPWRRARDSEDVYKSIMGSSAVKGVFDSQGKLQPRIVMTVAALGNPVEQIGFWRHAWNELSTNWNLAKADPGQFNNLLYTIKAKVNEVYALHGDAVMQTDKLKAPNRDQVYQDMLSKHAGDEAAAVAKLRADIKSTSDAVSQAYNNKQWGHFRSLKAQADSLKEQLRQFQSAQWHNRPQSKEMHDAVRELTYFLDIGTPNDSPALAKAYQRVSAASLVPFQPTNEEAFYLSLPAAGKEAYHTLLSQELSMPPGMGKDIFAVNAAYESVGGHAFNTPFKKYWENLTDFQRDLMTKNYPAQVVNGWSGLDRATAEANAKGGKGGGRGGFSRGGKSFGRSELDYAFALMRQYSKRGGMAKPGAYAEYLTLPHNPAVRNAFLEKHPEVADYIKAGPMANMPPVYAMMVQDIMIRNGKWEGDPMSIGELTDISFAREQLDRYNKRTGPAPGTYDLWLNMPTGQGKADYLAAHPEIRAWIQLGPMANMPDIYRDVVRDIMYRYHEWSASSDGMGTVIADYYRTPSYARNQYLAQHPELAAYWAATRSTQDQAIGSMVDSYYATPDPGARAAMLESNPELKQYFLDSRARRYERFLNQVAQYMGANPSLFSAYLERQTQVMGDLLNKFAEPNLARERHWMAPQKANTKSSETGRTRQ